MTELNTKKEEILLAPLTGTVVTLEQVPDPTFAEKMLGDGMAIKPTGDTVVAPCSGMLTLVSDTKHAFALTSDEGLEILIHIGLETVKLAGLGFEQLVECGTRVVAGTPIMKVDLGVLEDNNCNAITPMVITNMEGVKITYTAPLDKCIAGETALLKLEID